MNTLIVVITVNLLAFNSLSCPAHDVKPSLIHLFLGDSMSFNIFINQPAFFKTLSVKPADMTEEDFKFFNILASTCEVMPNPAVDRTIFVDSYPLVNITDKSIWLKVEPEVNLKFSAESFERVIAFFKLTGTNNTLAYDADTNKFKLNKNLLKVGKFFKLMNPALTDVDVDTLSREYISNYKPAVVSFEDILPTIAYFMDTLPTSCAINDPLVVIWDKLGAVVKVRKENDKIRARTLIHKGKYFDKIYAFSILDLNRFKADLELQGYTPVATSGLVYTLPDTEDLPYIDSFLVRDNSLVANPHTLQF